MPSNQILSVRQMVAAEQALMDGGTSVHELMERAGTGAADWVWRISGGRPVTVLCGPGNNGGDGYVIARALTMRGSAVRVIAPIQPKTDAARNAAETYHGEVSAQAGGGHGAVFVDCLFGSGLSRPLSAEHTALIARLQAQHEISVAIDVPSGVDADSGTWPDGAGSCQTTLCLGAWKRAHWMGEASARMGRKVLIDIGVPDQGYAENVWPPPQLLPPEWDAHKYRRGLVAVIGGEMPGAGILSARAAMHAGVGYVKLLTESHSGGAPADLVIDHAPLCEALPDRRIAAVLAGPGLGRGAGCRERLAETLSHGIPAVLDADALHLLDPDMLEGCDTSTMVVTPHEGELSALCRAFDAEAPTKRERAIALHQQTGLTVLAKGPDTILAHADGVGYFPAGPSWLSVAGSGDVLAGIIASRLATGIDPADAAGEGVYLHHQAARQAGVAFSATELAQCVRSAYAAFL